jgi:hypothetical protein
MSMLFAPANQITALDATMTLCFIYQLAGGARVSSIVRHHNVMNRKDIVISVALLAIGLITCALLVRDGLVSIATEIRQKPLPRFPESLNVSQVTIRQATLEAATGTNGNHNVKINIENMKVDSQISQPITK